MNPSSRDPTIARRVLLVSILWFLQGVATVGARGSTLDTLDALNSRGEYRAALARVEALLARRPNDPRLLARAAASHLGLGEKAKARHLLVQAYAHPRTPEKAVQIARELVGGPSGTINTVVDLGNPIVDTIVAICESLARQDKTGFQRAAPIDVGILTRYWTERTRTSDGPPIGRTFVTYVMGTLPFFLPICRKYVVTELETHRDRTTVAVRFSHQGYRVFGRWTFVEGTLVDLSLGDNHCGRAFDPRHRPGSDAGLAALESEARLVVRMKSEAVLGTMNDAAIQAAIARARYFPDRMRVIRAQALKIHDREDEAMAAWEEARKGSPLETAEELAQIFLARGEPGRAAREFESIQALFPGDEEILLDLADCRLKLDEDAEARKLAAESLRLRPGSGNWKALLIMARIQARRGDPAAAARILERIRAHASTYRWEPDLGPLRKIAGYRPLFGFED